MRADTVGPAAPNVDIRISDDGEVQFRSPGMFSGYFKQEETTRRSDDRRTATSGPATPASSSRTGS